MSSPRTPHEIYRDALTTLETEPGPMTPEKAELMRYLRDRLTDCEASQRLTRTHLSSQVTPRIKDH